MTRHRQPAVPNEPDTGDRNQLLELIGMPAAQDYDVGEQADQPAERLKGLRPSRCLGWVRNDVREGAVEVGDED